MIALFLFGLRFARKGPSGSLVHVSDGLWDDNSIRDPSGSGHHRLCPMMHVSLSATPCTVCSWLFSSPRKEHKLTTLLFHTSISSLPWLFSSVRSLKLSTTSLPLSPFPSWVKKGSVADLCPGIPVNLLGSTSFDPGCSCRLLGCSSCVHPDTVERLRLVSSALEAALRDEGHHSGKREQVLTGNDFRGKLFGALRFRRRLELCSTTTAMGLSRCVPPPCGTTAQVRGTPFFHVLCCFSLLRRSYPCRVSTAGLTRVPDMCVCAAQPFLKQVCGSFARVLPLPPSSFRPYEGSYQFVTNGSRRLAPDLFFSRSGYGLFGFVH